MAYSVPLILYVIIQFAAFLLVLAGTPSGMFRSGSPSFPGPFGCITLWGLKLTCASVDYNVTIHFFFRNCRNRLNLFRAAQGLAIVTIFVYGAAFILGLILLYGCSFLRWVCLALNIVGIATLCVVWAALAVMYNKTDDPQCSTVREMGYRFGAGFVLFLVSWILDIINTFMLLLPCTVPATKAPEKVESPTAEE
ncbi:uncharacterized protein [Leishmania mexicana MHOM/GT/2001/U1103]|uniref:Uncharacterized protein n=1 Tax=Leishmania mexicana (strain MHOM/GT/2001/U1103) TaxID=929439 RepID=E8NHR7_LEIMU|nr:uncharacterized protein [Leishmania mexicana MHOM/GT/2001/U1103]CBZ41042.1 unnamed protein product [Leishmania mexicana MHOM/GT/2001/U1103]